ncbi:MAG: hypothetical protein ACAF41_25935 [Leptolyngbya sp. BL-A-14]
MNIQIKARSVSIMCGLVVAIALSSCSKKPDEAATAPSPAMSATPSTPAASPSMAASPSAMSSTAPQTAATLSPTAETLGVKPTNETTCPKNAPVKGKVTKKRGNIYHVAKEPDFAKVKPEICFKDTATAEKAGFRAPKQ